MTATELANKLQDINTHWQTLLNCDGGNFAEPLDNLIAAYNELGECTEDKWPAEQVSKWLDNCTQLAEHPNATSIVSALRFKLSNDRNESTILIYQEVLWCLSKDDPRAIKEILSLLESFPNNHWFKMLYCNVASSYQCTEFDLEDLEERFILCLAHMNSLPSPQVVAGYYLSSGLSLFHKYLQYHDIDSAHRIKSLLEKEQVFVKSQVFSNMLYNLDNELQSARSLQNLSNSLEEKLNSVVDSAHKKGFEQLVIFTAVITFVITAAGSVKDATLPLWQLVGLGMTFLVFVLSIMLCLERPNWSDVKKDLRFWILTCAFGLTASLAGISAFKTIDIEANCFFGCTTTIELPEFLFEEDKEYPLPPSLIQLDKE